MIKEFNLLSCMWREGPRHEVVVQDSKNVHATQEVCIRWVLFYKISRFSNTRHLNYCAFFHLGTW